MKFRLIAVVALSVVAMGLLPILRGQGAPVPQPASPSQGQIKAVRVVGDVGVQRGANSAMTALKENDALHQGDTVITAKNSSVVLVFSNGSTISVAQDSKLAIDQFLQDPFGQEIKVADLTGEPSTSHTKLNLTYGELVGNVKKLKGDSSFLVQTPVGAAGIRGTTFMVTYRPTGTGQAFFSLSTSTGEMIYQPSTGEPVAVPADKGVQVQVTIDDTTHAVVSVTVTSTNLTDEQKQTIQTQVTEALQSSSGTTFINQTTTGSTDQSNQNNQNNQNNQQNQNQPQQQNTPYTTTGAGTPG